MLEDVKRNKFKTGVIVSIFIIIVTLVVYFVCYYKNLGPISILIGLATSIFSAFITYYNSDKIILSLNKARPATPEEDQKLVNILDALVIASGLEHTPRLYVMDCEQPNAFATGRNPEHAVICVTTGLLEKMDYYELEGVVAHELAHVKNYDIRLSAVVSVMVGLLLMLSDYCTRTVFNRNSDRNVNYFIYIIGLILLIFSPIIASLMQLAISRRREYLADATAVEFTRNPQGLISALRKLDEDSTPMDKVNSSTAHMFISDPDKRHKKARNLFSTHPPIEDRIHALENIK